MLKCSKIFGNNQLMTLGDGLKSVKSKFGAVGKNLSEKQGVRIYRIENGDFLKMYNRNDSLNLSRKFIPQNHSLGYPKGSLMEIIKNYKNEVVRNKKFVMNRDIEITKKTTKFRSAFYEHWTTLTKVNRKSMSCKKAIEKGFLKERAEKF